MLLRILLLSVPLGLFGQSPDSLTRQRLDLSLEFCNYHIEGEGLTADQVKIWIASSALLPSMPPDSNRFIQNTNTSVQGFFLKTELTPRHSGGLWRGVRPSFRFGIGVFDLQSTLRSYFDWASTRTDTLISTSTGAIYFVDSTHWHHGYVDIWSNLVKMEVSSVFRSDPKYLCSFYFGVGLGFGLLYNMSTIVRIDHNSSTIFLDSTGNIESQVQSGYGRIEFDRFKNKNGFLISSFLPFGLDFKFHHTHPLWRKIHVFYEGRVETNWTYLPNMSSLSASELLHAAGLRIRWE